MKVCLVTATKNRHSHLERLVRFTLNQTSNEYTHLIFNNSEIPLRLNKSLPVDKFILVNHPISDATGSSYTTLGEIYTDAIKHIPGDCDVINFMDDDDVFFNNHVEEGIKGLIKGGLIAYKPEKSWYKQGKLKAVLVNNTMEPSIFVRTEHVKQYGFSLETTAQHLQWINPLVYERQIFSDKDGKPTYICDWSQEIPTYKTSGNPSNPNNFENYSLSSKDIGDGVITPISESWAKHYCRL